MKNKSIISLVSFFLLSMLYVAPAIAGATYLNVYIPKECGNWKVAPGAQHCIVRGRSSGEAGGDAAFKCVGGGNGKGGVGINTQHCPQTIFSHHVYAGPSLVHTMHTIYVSKGSASCFTVGGCNDTETNTLEFRICHRGMKGSRCRYDDNPLRR
jgi:hypothetical protein